MPDAKTEIVRHLPSLRQYARCLMGSQDRGDRYVRLCLETILADPSLIVADQNVRVGLFRVFHALWVGALTATEIGAMHPVGGAAKLQRHINALPAAEREALLLATLGEFPIDDVATILAVSRDEALIHLDRARAQLAAQTVTTALVIEDEPVIAFDLASILASMGHRVIGIADTHERAVEVARTRRPGIVLADILLRDGSSGIEAVQEILESIDAPVIFVTAFPERLLTGERREPAYLITKPFDTEVLKVTIAQALLLHPCAPAAAAS